MLLTPVLLFVPSLVPRALWTVLRHPAGLAWLILGFTAAAAACLVASYFVFQGWWQGVFQNLGVSLLLVGVVNLGILGALRDLIEGKPTQPRRAPKGSTPADAERETAVVQQLRDVVDRLEQRLTELGTERSNPGHEVPPGCQPL